MARCAVESGWSATRPGVLCPAAVSSSASSATSSLTAPRAVGGCPGSPEHISEVVGLADLQPDPDVDVLRCGRTLPRSWLPSRAGRPDRARQPSCALQASGRSPVSLRGLSARPCWRQHPQVVAATGGDEPYQHGLSSQSRACPARAQEQGEGAVCDGCTVGAGDLGRAGTPHRRAGRWPPQRPGCATRPTCDPHRPCAAGCALHPPLACPSRQTWAARQNGAATCRGHPLRHARRTLPAGRNGRCGADGPSRRSDGSAQTGGAGGQPDTAAKQRRSGSDRVAAGRSGSGASRAVRCGR